MDRLCLLVGMIVLMSILVPAGQAVKNNAENYIQQVENLQQNLGQ